MSGCSDEVKPIDGIVSNFSDSKLALAWLDLTFQRRSLFGKKMLLNKLTGQANFGEVTALMGPSGAGKTTLLKCLYGIDNSGLTRDSKLFVSKQRNIESCFIVQEQTEHLLMRLTVRESLVYGSKLKNSGARGFDHKRNVQNVIDELKLFKCADNLVVTCSGGEQKRLAIGLELTAVCKPNLMLLDEPTTGLDSDAAERVMSIFHQLASRHQMAVIISIHQPNADILNLTDHLYVLSVSGHCVFDGQPRQVRQHLKDCGVRCHDSAVPIQTLLKAATKIKVVKNNFIQLSPEIRKMSELTLTIQKNLREQIKENGRPLVRNLKTNFKSFSLLDVWYLLNRNFKNYVIKGWKFQLLHVFVLLLGCSLLTFLFPSEIGTDPSCPPDIINNYNLTDITNKLIDSINGHRTKAQMNVSFMTWFSSYFMFVHILAFGINFPKQIKVFYSEHNNGWYSTTSFYLVMSLLQLPMLLVPTYIYLLIGYYFSSQPGMSTLTQAFWNVPEQFKVFFLLWFLVALNIQGIAQAIGIIFANQLPLAVVSCIGTLMVQFLFDDYIIPIQESGAMAQLIGQLSLMNLVFRNSLIVLYGDETCDGDESTVLSFYWIEEDKYWLNIQFIIWQTVFWFTFGLLTLLWKSNQVFYKIQLKIKGLGKSNKITNEMSLQEFSNQIIIEEDGDKENDSEIIKIKPQIETNSISMALAWQNLKLTLQRKIILKELNGLINFGELSALMGPSGAGKTTLLKCISGINQLGLSQESKLFISKHNKINCCFLVQNHKEHLFMNLKVKESLMYASKLKNSQEKGFDHKQNVKQITEEFLLTNCINNVISKCSGGEQKRLAIGQELTAKEMPNLICMDEPTSGLDSCSAELTVACLRRLAHDKHVAVVASIHQPDEDVLNLFDHLYTLSIDGRCIFDGKPNQIKEHLQQCDVSCSDWQVPVEELIKAASGKQEELENDKNTIDILSAQSKQNSKIIQNDLQLLQDQFDRKWQYFNLQDFCILLSRHFHKHVIRDWKMFLILFVYLYYSSFSLLLIFPPELGKDPGCPQTFVDLTNISTINEQILDGLTGKEQKYYQSIKFIYFNNIFSLLTIALVFCFLFNNDHQVFFNEHRNGWYSSSSFFFSRCLIELPLLFVLMHPFSFVIYIGTSQPDVEYWYQFVWDVPTRFLLFSLVMFLGCFAANGVSVMSSAINSRHFPTTIIVLSCIGHISAWFNGMFVPFPKLNFFFQILGHFSFIRYLLESLVITLYRDRCESRPIMFNVFEIEENILEWNIFKLALLGIGLRLFAYLLLVLKTNNRKS